MYHTTVKNIPYGNSGILVSADHLVAIIKHYRRSPEIRLLGEEIVQSCPGKDYRCELSRIYWWVKNNIRYARDPYRVEMLRSPLITIERGNGDCDDHVILTNALLQSMGFRTRIVLVATRKHRPKNFNHVFTEALLGNNWIAMDTTVAKANVGWKPPGFTYKIIPVEE